MLGRTMIDLFAGAGGMSVGFHRAGFHSVLAVEFDHWAAETYRANFHSEVFEGDIADLNFFPKADVIIGGPPCQGFSPLGKNPPNDPRNRLWREYLRAVEQMRPKVFVMENVPELLKSGEFQQLVDLAGDLKYKLRARILNAADYGVPQRRRRAIVLGSRLGALDFPEPTHGLDGNLMGLEPFSSVRDAIGDLPLEPTGEDWHIGRNPTELSRKRYRCIPPGGNRFDLPYELQPNCWRKKKTGTTDVFGRLEWDKPSLTIRTEFYKPEKGCYLHPQANRPITHREAARLQTFPDDFEFVGSKIQVARQIGNAVPCRLAQRIAETVALHLDNSKARKKRSICAKKLSVCA